MLTSLRAKNLPVLSDVNLDFDSGLSAITGETGAGKSMLLSAFALISGKNVDRVKTNLQPETNIEVEVVFEDIPESVRKEIGNSLHDEDASSHDTFDEVIISRKISGATKRAKQTVNLRSVPAAFLGDLTKNLIVVHGQQDQMRLKTPRKIREVLDQFAGSKEVFSQYQEIYAAYTSAKNQFDEMKNAREAAKKNESYYRYALEQIAKTEPKANEDEEIESRLNAMQNVAQIGKELDYASKLILGDAESGVQGAVDIVIALHKSIDTLKSLGLKVGLNSDDGESGYDDNLPEIVDRLNDISATISRELSTLELNDTSIDYLRKRSAQLNELKQSFGPELEDVLKFSDKARIALDDLADDTLFENQRAMIDELHTKCLEAAQNLGQIRRKAAKELSEQVTMQVEVLGFTNARVILEVGESENLGVDGANTFALLFSPHSSLTPSPLQDVASGGELSRIMLAIEVVLAQKTKSDTNSLPLMVFDEVDAGVGGVAASKVGDLLKELSKSTQVIVVTHLANIAALADKHFGVTKTSGDSKTNAQVCELNLQERKNEIARMLSGEVSEISLAHASELLQL